MISQPPPKSAAYTIAQPRIQRSRFAFQIACGRDVGSEARNWKPAADVRSNMAVKIYQDALGFWRGQESYNFVAPGDA